jgi:hypothetical protein
LFEAADAQRNSVLQAQFGYQLADQRRGVHRAVGAALEQEAVALHAADHPTGTRGSVDDLHLQAGALGAVGGHQARQAGPHDDQIQSGRGWGCLASRQRSSAGT